MFRITREQLEQEAIRQAQRRAVEEQATTAVYRDCGEWIENRSKYYVRLAVEPEPDSAECRATVFADGKVDLYGDR